jgi:predicted house-cleaning noncanonical NTP pyrophosphatase (MazG superfamily)
MIFDKIVRDNIPEIIQKHNRQYVTRTAGKIEAVRYLIKKLHEETDELGEVLTPDYAIEELADILECVFAIAGKMGITKIALEAQRKKKAITNGRFTKDIILVSMEGDKF